MYFLFTFIHKFSKCYDAKENILELNLREFNMARFQLVSALFSFAWKLITKFVVKPATKNETTAFAGFSESETAKRSFMKRR